MNLMDAATFAFNMLDKHGLSAGGWTFEFDRSVRRFGACHHDARKVTISSRLTLMNDEAHVQNTVLHEIAHALAGPKKGHGEEWKNVARRVGAKPVRCYAASVEKPPEKFIGVCPSCGATYLRNRRPRMAACPPCCRKHNDGKFDRRFVVRFTLNQKVAV